MWATLMANESDLADYFCQIGLALVIDRSEGLAYLKQLNDDERTGGYERLPRLFRKTPLGYDATLLCVLLRDEYRRFRRRRSGQRKLPGQRRVPVRPVEIILLGVCRRDFSARTLVKALNQLEKLKFVRNIKSHDELWEVRKLLKARVPLEELENLLDRLRSYQEISET